MAPEGSYETKAEAGRKWRMRLPWAQIDFYKLIDFVGSHFRQNRMMKRAGEERCVFDEFCQFIWKYTKIQLGLAQFSY